MTGILYLIPVPIGSENFRKAIPDEVIQITLSLRYFIVEKVRSARRYLKLLDRDFPVDESVFYTLNENTPVKELYDFLQPLLEGHDVGLMSEAGIPCIADPGSMLVRMAHQKGIKVIPLPGPSSIYLALAASGLNGQKFTFNGYLPVKEDSLRKRLKELEKRSEGGEAQIFMETPYRASRMLKYILETCNSATYLCIAVDITLPGEKIETKRIYEWKKNIPDLNDHLVIFILQSAE